jgi:hypothetical protein
MKKEVLAAVRKWLIGSGLLVGMVYSVVTLTVNAAPAEAASCNCPVERSEAEQRCGGPIVNFVCPVNSNPPSWVAECALTGQIVADTCP